MACSIDLCDAALRNTALVVGFAHKKPPKRYPPIRAQTTLDFTLFRVVYLYYIFVSSPQLELSKERKESCVALRRLCSTELDNLSLDEINLAYDLRCHQPEMKTKSLTYLRAC